MTKKRLVILMVCVAVSGALLAIAAAPGNSPKKNSPKTQKSGAKNNTSKWAPEYVAFGEFTNPLVAESSGLSVSQTHKDILWTHNDSGNPPIIYSSDLKGNSIGQISIPVRNIDWEDLFTDATGLYIADTGNNDYDRSTLQFYRFKEPDPKARLATLDRQWTLKPPANFNCEAFVIADSQVYLFNKCESPAIPHLYRFPLDGQGVISLEDRGDVNIPSPITSAALSPDNKFLAILSVDGLRVYPRLQTIEKTLTQSPKHFPILRRQVEGCVFIPEGILVSTEAGMLIRLSREKYSDEKTANP